VTHHRSPARILTVEDEAAIRRLVVEVLQLDGYEVDEAGDALSAMSSLVERPPDLVLLDIGLPGSSGLDLLAHVRRTSDVPVILLTGADAEEQRIGGLRGGADDYVVKPFSDGELLARIESVLRRARRAGGAAATPVAAVSTDGDAEIVADGLAIDTRAREARVHGLLVDLTAREFDLLAFLASSPRQVFNREQILRHVWGSSSEWQDPATVTEHVRRIRRKVEPEPDRPRWIQTVRGVGYRFEP
jgi:DNA-binding response OmpR family regulator